jgi:hypothetical protein
MYLFIKGSTPASDVNCSLEPELADRSENKADIVLLENDIKSNEKVMVNSGSSTCFDFTFLVSEFCETNNWKNTEWRIRHSALMGKGNEEIFYILD